MTEKTKLTKAQARMLRDFATPADRPYASVMNRTAEALERHGLLKWKPARFFGGRWEITPAGLSLLGEGDDG